MTRTARNRERIRAVLAAETSTARLATFCAGLSFSLRTLAGISPECPACSHPASRRRICARCLSQSTGAGGPWQTRQLASEGPLPGLSVRYLGRYECEAPGGRCRIASVLTNFKYGRRRDLGRVLAALVEDCPPPARPEVDRVVPVPLAPADLRRRGFNQAAWLARPIAASLGVPVAPDFLYRIADEGPQAGRHASARRRRRSPFRAGPQPLDAARILLVDDVCTTGTTLLQAATALLCAGALRVDAAVLLNSARRVST